VVFHYTKSVGAEHPDSYGVIILIYNILIGRVDCGGMMQNSPDPPCRRDFCAENLPESRRSLNYKNKSGRPQRRDPVRMMVNREQPIESPSFRANLPIRKPSRSAAPVNPNERGRCQSPGLTRRDNDMLGAWAVCLGW
jgi:hypothetical protein